MRGIDIFQKPYYREISTMRGRTMRGLPVVPRNFLKLFSTLCGGSTNSKPSPFLLVDNLPVREAIDQFHMPFTSDTAR